jgi:NAD-dependent deacetylase
MHGELLKAKCTRCGDRLGWLEDLGQSSQCSSCEAIGSLRPDVVWFGEMPMHMDEIEDALTNANLFLSIGTSGNVYPAAGFAEIAHQSGAYTVELNLERSLGASLFDRGLYGPATEVVENYVQELLSGSER